MKKIFTIFACLMAFVSFSQTVPVYTFPTIPSTGTQLQNGDNINNNTYKVFTGNGSITNINLNGGTLYVKSGANLTLQVNFNSGRVVVAQGATLNIGGLNFNGNTSLFNRGTVNVSGNGELQNGGDTVVNESTFGLTGEIQFSSSNSFMVNKGCVSFNTVSYHSGYLYGYVGSQVSANTFTDDMNNGLVSVNGAWILKIVNTLNIQNITSFTNTPLTVCTSGTINGSNHLGSATTTTTCSSCIPTALPVVISYFKYSSPTVYWSFSNVTNVSYIDLQVSSNAVDFGNVRTFYNNQANIEYNQIILGAYLRLKITDLNGSVSYSNIIATNERIIIDQPVQVFTLKGELVGSGKLKDINLDRNTLYILKTGSNTSKIVIQ